MKRMFITNGRLLSYFLSLIILIFVLSGLTLPAFALEPLEVVLQQGDESNVFLDIPNGDPGNLVVKNIPAGVTGQVLQVEPGKEIYVRLAVSKDADPGRYDFEIEDEVELRPVASGILEIVLGVKVDLLKLDIKEENILSYAIMLKNLDDEPLNLTSEAHLTVTEPLSFSTDGKEWLREGNIFFNYGVSELFLTSSSETIPWDGQLLIHSDEIGFTASASLIQEFATPDVYDIADPQATGIFTVSSEGGSNNSPETALEIFPGQQITTSIEYQGDEKWFKITVNDTSSLVATLTNNSGSVYYRLYDESLELLQYNSFGSSGRYGWKVSPGTYYIRLSGSSTVNYLISNITMKVDIREEDPWENNDVSQRAVELTPGQQLSGIAIEAENDYDWFKITVNDTSSLVATLTNNSGSVYYRLYDESLGLLQYNSFGSSGRYGWKVSPGTYYIRLSGSSTVNYLISNITIKVDIREEDPWENNDVPQRAVELTPGQQLTGIAIEAENDYDWFKITVNETSSLVATLTNNSGSVYYRLYDESLEFLQYNSISSSGRYGWKVSPGTYYIRLSGSSTVNYLISNITIKVDIREEDPWENNDVPQRAVELTPGQQLPGIAIEAENDYDWFKITVSHNGSLAVTLTNNSGSVYYDLYNASLQKLYGSYISSSPKTFTHEISPGVYYIRLSERSSINYLNNNITMTIKLDYGNYTYEYNANGQLIHILLGDIPVIRFNYDQNGNLINKEKMTQ